MLLENPIALGGSKGSVGFVEVDDHRRPVERGAELRGVALDRVLIDRDRRAVRLARAVQEGGQHSVARQRSEEHTSELQSLMRISYAVFCLKKKTKHKLKQQ